MTPFYQLTATRLRGQPLSMSDYAGKVVLVVNTASVLRCEATMAGRIHHQNHLASIVRH